MSATQAIVSPVRAGDPSRYIHVTLLQSSSVWRSLPLFRLGTIAPKQATPNRCLQARRRGTRPQIAIAVRYTVNIGLYLETTLDLISFFRLDRPTEAYGLSAKRPNIRTFHHRKLSGTSSRSPSQISTASARLPFPISLLVLGGPRYHLQIRRVGRQSRIPKSN